MNWTGLDMDRLISQGLAWTELYRFGHFFAYKKRKYQREGAKTKFNNIPIFYTNYHIITLNYAHIIILTEIILSSQLYDNISANQVSTDSNRAV